MNNPSRVDILETTQDLVHQKLDMIIGELLRADDVVQVSPHEVGHHVHLLKLLQCFLRAEDVQHAWLDKNRHL